MTHTLVIHFLELSLKGKNRSWFINQLVRSIRSVLAGLDVSHVRHVQGRIEARLGRNENWPEIRERLRGLPGIANFACAVEVPVRPGDVGTGGIDAIWEAMRPMLDGRTPGSFRVKMRRVNKQFPIESPVVERTLGERVIAEKGWRVNLSNPELTLRVEALGEHALVYAVREPGAGGLPLGTGGKVLCLLSGGIDSPVAAWRMIRRGCTALFVHFHAYPILSIASQNKARELAGILAKRQLKSKLFLVPFGSVQQQIVLAVPPPLRVVMYRRFMVRIAEEIARKHNALALVTGDVVGQVASQTLENIAAVNQVATMPIQRPRISCDKEEITADAREIGTYETSILEDQDCCTLFTPELPSTRTTLRLIEDAEQALDVPALVAMALEGLEGTLVVFPS
jgi:thiamine biosynthesis protein ThiI